MAERVQDHLLDVMQTVVILEIHGDLVVAVVVVVEMPCDHALRLVEPAAAVAVVIEVALPRLEILEIPVLFQLQQHITV